MVGLGEIITAESDQLLAVVKQTLTFSVTFNAVNQVMHTGTLSSGVYTGITALTFLMALIGIKLKLAECLPPGRPGGHWALPLGTVLQQVIGAAVGMAAMFASNLVAKVLVDAASSSEAHPGWVAWWALLSLVLVSIYEALF